MALDKIINFGDRDFLSKHLSTLAWQAILSSPNNPLAQLGISFLRRQ